MPGKGDAPVKAKESFVVMTKPVGSRCNMHCAYCYYLEKYQFSDRPDQSHMSYDLLEKYIRQYIEANTGPTVPFTWHGGEPTLAGLDFFKRALELQKKYLPSGWTIWNNIQTNGILLNDAWCSFLAENSFDVGLSIDGAQWVHDHNRVDRGGHPTYEKVAASAKRLMAHGVRPDLLCTVTSTSCKDPLGVYHGLRDLGTGWMQFIPIVVRTPDGGVTEESVTPDGYGDFLCAVFDEWITHDLGRTNVQLFAEASRVWGGGEASLCWMAPTCGRVLIVEQDGNVYSCDHFVDPEHRIGNIRTSTLGELVDLPEQVAFGNAKRDALTKQCRECPHLNVCNGSCLKDRFAKSDDGEDGLYYLCHGLRRFFSHAEKPMKMAIRLARQNKGAHEIMEEIKKTYYAK